MSVEKKAIIKATIAGAVSIGLVLASGSALAKKTELEKQYGVAKAGKNDCGGAGMGHACQGQSTNAKKSDLEKCYGVAKAGKNDCGGVGIGHACQGQSTKDGATNEYILLPKGTCDKIVGGSTKSSAAKTSANSTAANQADQAQTQK